MTATLTPTPELPDVIDLTPKRSGRSIRNGIATALMGVSLVVVMVPLLLILGSVIQKGASVMSWSFLTDDIPPVRREGPGMGPAVVGTIVITLTAAAMAIPLGIFGAVYLHEYGKTGKLAQMLRFFADVMTGVPSIIMGLFIYTIWVVRFGVNGVTGFAGALAVGCLMLPIVIRSTEEMLKLVPDDLREASFALGSSPGPHGLEGRAARGVARDPERRAFSAVARAAARPPRCCSRSARPKRSTGTSSRARTPPSPRRSSRMPNSRSSAPRNARGVPRSRSSS